MVPVITDAEKIIPAAGLGGRGDVDLSTDAIALFRVGRPGLGLLPLERKRSSARRKVFGEESPEGKTWADELMHVFKHEGCAVAWERLLPWRTELRGKTKRKAADRLLHFVSAQGHDPLSGVPGAWLADWQRPDRIAMQAMHEAAEGLRPPPGPVQRHGRGGPRYAGQNGQWSKSGQTPPTPRLKAAQNAGHWAHLAVCDFRRLDGHSGNRSDDGGGFARNGPAWGCR